MSQEIVPTTPAPQLFVIDNYAIEMGAIQNPDGVWELVLQLFNQPDTEHESNTPPEQVFMIHGKMTYDQWEYALDEGLNIIESLGFSVNQDHEFDVLFWNNDTQVHDFKLAKFDGDQFNIHEVDNG